MYDRREVVKFEYSSKQRGRLLPVLDVRDIGNLKETSEKTQDYLNSNMRTVGSVPSR